MKHSTNSLLSIIIMIILLTTINVAYPREVIAFGGFIHKEEIGYIKLLTIIIDDNHTYLDIEAKTKYGAKWNFDDMTLIAYGNSNEILYKSSYEGWRKTSDYDHMDLGEWDTYGFYLSGKNNILLRFKHPLYNNVKKICFVDSDGESTFGDIPLNLTHCKPMLPTIEEESIREKIDSIKKNICGIYEYSLPIGRGGKYKHKIYCLQEANKFIFYNLENTEYYKPGEKIGECFATTDGKHYKGEWINRITGVGKNSIFELDKTFPMGGTISCSSLVVRAFAFRVQPV